MEKVLKVSVMLAAIDKMSSVIEKASTSGIKSLTRLNKEADRISKSAFDLGRSAGAFGLALGAPLYGAVQAAADVETMQIALKTAFQGNEQAANKAYETINKFAAKTPYELNEVMTGFIKLKNMGLDPSTEALTAYGNTASAMGKSLNDMVEAVADAATGEFERLKEFGIRASSEGDKVKFTFQGVTTTVKKDAGQIELYLKNLGLTKFAGGIEAQSKSFKGQMSTMMDSIKMFAASLGKVLIPVITDLFQKLAPVLEQVQTWMEKNPQLTKYIVYGTAAIVALSFAVSALSFVFGGLMKIVQAVSSTVSFLTRVVRFSTQATRFMTGAVRTLWTTTSGLRGVIIRLIGSLFSWGTVSKLQTAAQYAMNLAMSIGKAGAYMLGGAFNFVTGAVRVLNAVMKANPIILIIMIIIGLVIAIIENWSKLVAFFKNLWESIKNIFSSAYNWIVKQMKVPIMLFKKGWESLKGFFKDLWESVKKPFVDFWNWLTGLGKMFVDAGKNIVNSIWNGIKSAFGKMMEGWKNMWKKVREYLPFSPAKEGPLKDINRIRLVETIAENVKPAPMVKAMSEVTKKVRSAIPKQTGLAGAGVMAGGMGGFGGGLAGAGAGGGMVVNFSPTINMAGGSAQERQDFLSMLKQYEPDLLRVIRDAMERNDRKKFS